MQDCGESFFVKSVAVLDFRNSEASRNAGLRRLGSATIAWKKGMSGKGPDGIVDGLKTPWPTGGCPPGISWPSMRHTLSFRCSGTPNWRALHGFSTSLARRCGAGGEWLIGVGELDHMEAHRPGRAFEQLGTFLEQHGDWAFGHLTYAMGAEVEPGLELGQDLLGWPTLRFFVPRFVVHWGQEDVQVHCRKEDHLEAEHLVAVLTGSDDRTHETRIPRLNLIGRSEYLERAGELLAHIQRGDIYEVNYCIARTGVARGLDPYAAFAALDTKLKAPYATFYRSGERYALCQSPERFLKVEDGMITGEPMKGTRPRHTDSSLDQALALELANDAKERSENIMAVDVMRHDMSRVAAPRSVRVPELCGVKSLSALHQMTSTVSARLREGLRTVDAVRSCFPMASMTGAPKRRAMQLINAMEGAPRGLYSGTLGFFTPDGDADFNVVIRTLLFDARSGAVSLATGSALTAACDLEREWEECEIKARSVLDALGHVD